MPDANGNFKGMSVPAAAWDRIFGAPACAQCGDTGMVPDPDRGSGWGPYWDTPCTCQANRDSQPTGR